MLKELDEILYQDCLALLQKHASVEPVLQYLREAGCSKIASINALMRLLNISLKPAKELVHTSVIWSDRKASDDYFHKRLYAALDQMLDENSLDNVGNLDENVE